jgi:hypothetical protein
MTPKEKAKQLVERYLKETAWMPYSAIPTFSKVAKGCAIIAVNEILESKPTIPFNATNPYSESTEVAALYWEEVKIEIDYL